MTVRELYNYAISHSLIDQQVDDVLAIYYNKETSLNILFSNNILNRISKDVLLFSKIKVTLRYDIFSSYNINSTYSLNRKLYSME